MLSAEEQKLISVIVPIYNVAPFLGACLDSILNQSYSNTEVILVDDASTDGAQAILRAYAERDQRVRVIFHPNNRGAWAARNSALQVASGSYVSFLDGDDLWEPRFLEIMSTELDRLDDHCDGVFCWSRTINVSGKPTGKFARPRAGRYRLADMMAGVCPPRSGSALMLRRKCFEAVGGFAPISGHDAEMWLRILARSPVSCFQCIPELLVQYRHRPGSLSSHSPEGRMDSLRYRLERYLKQIPPQRRPEVYVSFASYALSLRDSCVTADVKRWSRAALTTSPSVVFKENGMKMLFVAFFGYTGFHLVSRFKWHMWNWRHRASSRRREAQSSVERS